MSGVLSTERLQGLAVLAAKLVREYGLQGRWRWIGHPDGHSPNLYLATSQHGQVYVMGFDRAGMSSGQPLFPVSPGDRDSANGRVFGRMCKAAEIPVFEVCRDATTRDDPRVYRTDVVGFRSPVAEYLAELDAETVLALVETASTLWAELVRHEHEALRWEHPAPIPEWTQRIREQLGRPWEPDDCGTCGTGPGRYYRDRHMWPRLYGWSPEGVEVPL